MKYSVKKTAVILFLVLIINVCLVLSFSACSLFYVLEDLWEYDSVIVTSDTYSEYESSLESNCFGFFGNGIFDTTSVSELETGKTYYYVVGVNAETSDGTDIDAFNVSFEISTKNRTTGDSCNACDCISVISLNGNNKTGFYTDNQTLVSSFDVAISGSSAWKYYAVGFTVSNECNATFMCNITGTVYVDTRGGNTKSTKRTHKTSNSAEALYDKQVKINSLNISYLSEENFNNGAFNESDFTSSPSLTIASSAYMVIDFEMESAYDAGTDKITVEIAMSPYEYFSGIIIDANTSTVTEQSVSGDFSIANATYSLPEHSGGTRSERLIIRIDAYITSTVNISVYFYGDAVSATGNAQYSKSSKVSSADTEDDSGLSYSFNSERNSVASIGANDSLKSVTFSNTSGWNVKLSSSSTSDTSVDVTNAGRNATYFTSTYLYYYWYRT